MVFLFCFFSSALPPPSHLSSPIPSLTYPSPQASRSSTLTPRNYTNSLSGKPYEWRDGGRGGKRLGERKSVFVRPPTSAQFCMFSASPQSQKKPFKQEKVSAATYHDKQMCLLSIIQIPPQIIRDYNHIIGDLNRFL